MISPLEYLTKLLTITSCYLCQSEGDIVCSACVQATLLPDDKRCYICNKITKNTGRCSTCRSNLKSIWWLSSYQKDVKEIIKQMKYQRRRDYARTFGVRLAETVSFLAEDTVIIPVPTAASRVRIRGFDQAKLMAKSLAKQLDLPYLDLLERKNQVDLIGKTRRQRIDLMKDSFGLKRDIQAENVLLVDDVITTGATLESTARLLRDYGVKHVSAAVAAH